jgi:hypothetical protein
MHCWKTWLNSVVFVVLISAQSTSVQFTELFVAWTAVKANKKINIVVAITDRNEE